MTKALDILMKADVRAFILAHEETDVSALALKKSPDPSWPYPLILDQIKARQKAKHKIPLWLTHHPDIIFPPSDVMEQASSAATARYKASIIKGDSFADLTGGAGVDCAALSEHFETGYCIEQNADAASLIRHNMALLSDKDIKVFNEMAEDFIESMPEIDLVYLDPQRRDKKQKGLFQISDCSPNILELLPTLKSKAKQILIKTSPMLDITKAIQDLECVQAVHIVEWKGQCKEVLYVLNPNLTTSEDDIIFKAVMLNNEGAVIKEHSFKAAQEKGLSIEISEPEKYLYEPGPAFLKAGGFKTLAKRFDIKKLHPHTHLFTSNDYIEAFPGRGFKIIDILPVQRKAMPVNKANLTVRNFPDSVENLRKKLKLKEGGNEYLFACTGTKNHKIVIHCHKLS